ncbi:MAG: hypothetical protein Phog2KO_47960 [Phototrophicaceae bacterium]
MKIRISAIIKWIKLTFANVGWYFFYVAILVIIIGHILENGSLDFTVLWDTMWANFGAELLSIAATVLIIDRLNVRRARDELILSIKSSDNKQAVELMQSLQRKNWLSLEKKSLACNLEDSKLNGMVLKRANLERFEFAYVELENADLRESCLVGANLNEAQLHRCVLKECDLRNATLSEANLSNAILMFAILAGANLNSANLRESILISADLRGANLSNADLSGANLQYAKIDNYTRLDNVILNGKQYRDKTLLLEAFDRLGVRVEGSES